MRSLSVGFEFGIGDVVYFKAAAHDRNRWPIRHQIVGRVARESPAGVELLYRLGTFEELVPELCFTRDEPPWQPPCEAQREYDSWGRTLKDVDAFVSRAVEKAIAKRIPADTGKM